MGKRDHGRLVQEARDALYRAGFMPTRITQLDVPGGLRPVRSPGFKVEKHNDGRSVRLFHVTAAAGARGRRHRMTLGHAQSSSLVSYNAALEREGFTRVGGDNQYGPAPYSLWRRASSISPTAPKP